MIKDAYYTSAMTSAFLFGEGNRGLDLPLAAFAPAVTLAVTLALALTVAFSEFALAVTPALAPSVAVVLAPALEVGLTSFRRFEITFNVTAGGLDIAEAVADGAVAVDTIG